MRPTRVSELVALLNGSLEIRGEEQPIEGFASLNSAGPGQLSFFDGSELSGVARTTRAGVVLVPQSFQDWPGQAWGIVRVDHPYHAMVTLLRNAHPASHAHALSRIARSAIIHPTAVVEGEVGECARVGPHCMVSRGSKVGEGCILEAHVVLYRGVELGPRNHVHSGVVMGSRGFGFYEYAGKRHAVPHFGGVRTGADCEFGPQTVVAAGFIEPTTIGDRCVFDSFVQIAHNCRLGNDLVFCSQSGLAGSVVVEDGVTLAGGAQVAGHLTLGKGCTIAAKAGVTRSVPPGATWAGFPAQPLADWRRDVILKRRDCHKSHETE